MKIYARVGFAVAFVSLLFTSITANSQVVGASLHGNVTDSSSAALPGATVVVRNLDTGFTRNATTTADGHYAVPSVPVGGYTITVSRDGFATQEKSGITLVVGQSLEVDFSLGLQSVSISRSLSMAHPRSSTSRRSRPRVSSTSVRSSNFLSTDAATINSLLSIQPL